MLARRCGATLSRYGQGSAGTSAAKIGHGGATDDGLGVTARVQTTVRIGWVQKRGFGSQGGGVWFRFLYKKVRDEAWFTNGGER